VTTCPLCDGPTIVAAGDVHACEACNLAGSRATLAAIGRLRVQADKRGRKSADVYQERDRCVAALAWLALRLGLRAGLGRHSPAPDPTWDPAWLTVVYVELPEGQVSWHVHERARYLFDGLPAYDPGWDGHGVEEKYRRLDSLRVVT